MGETITQSAAVREPDQERPALKRQLAERLSEIAQHAAGVLDRVVNQDETRKYFQDIEGQPPYSAITLRRMVIYIQDSASYAPLLSSAESEPGQKITRALRVLLNNDPKHDYDPEQVAAAIRDIEENLNLL